MKIGINTFLFASPFTNGHTALFPQFAKWGYDSVEIAVEDPIHLDPVLVKAALEAEGLTCGSVCACMSPDRDLRGDLTRQQTARKYLEDVLHLMVPLGCPRLVGPLYSSVGRAEAVAPSEYDRQWKTVVHHLQEIGSLAQQLGRTLCLEPLNRFETDFLNTCEQGLRLVEAVGCPAVQLHLDTFHMNIEEKNPAAAIRQAGSHLGHCHVSGSDRGTPGNDHLDWPGLWRALLDIDYAGDLVIESFTQDVKIIARAAAIWRRIEPDNASIARDGIRFLRHLEKTVGKGPG